MDTLFGHLASRFSPSMENIAIEALGFILAKSPAARRAFTGLAASGGTDLPNNMRFSTQATSEDMARPDIEAYGSGLAPICVVECKFWAGLTVNQPLTYAARLIGDRAGVLMFIVPSERLSSIWNELSVRMGDGGLKLSERNVISDEAWQAQFGDGKSFVLTTWRAVMRSMAHEMDLLEERDRIGDVRQLEGLCERIDSEAFHPFLAEELTSLEMPRRYLQFGSLVQDAVQQMLSSGYCNSDNGKLTTSSGPGYTGRYLKTASGMTCYLAFDCGIWSSYHLSPIWLTFNKNTDERTLAILRERSVYDDRVFLEQRQRIHIPIMLRPSVEREVLVDDIVRQVKAVVESISVSV